MSTFTVGRKGEDRAVQFLESQGLRIIDRNYRSRRSEIDLVALDRETIVFVEVKAWSAFAFEDLGKSITVQKQRRIIETAKFFLSEHREYNRMAVRFDVVFIGPEEVRHLAEAFMERV